MSSKRFYAESREQSEIKSLIVTKYFWAWAKVVTPSAKQRANRIAYIDLFAGPGGFKDGTLSTPLMLLEQALKEPDMREMLVTIFNDANADYSRSLEKAINSIPNISMMKYQPQIHHFEVGDQIAQMFMEMKLIPTLFFVDPWGYKGISLDLVGSVLKDWGCDCIFFFNYNRINMGLSNPIVQEHMNALFTEEKADDLRKALIPLVPSDRELLIIEELANALKEKGGDYVLPFRFLNKRGTRTSHHLIFVSKNILGYEIMKEIMARESSRMVQGVPSFEYNPADRRYPRLFDLSRPLEDLAEMLMVEFSGQELSMKQVYERHHVGKRYIKINYKKALRQLESQCKIQAKPPADERPKRSGEVTFADHVRVTFLE